MKIKWVLTASLALALPLAPARAGFWPITKRIPVELCGEYEQMAEIRTDGDQKELAETSGVFFRIETKRIVRINGETMNVKTVMRVKDKGKTAYLVSFKKTAQVWILAKGDMPTQLAVLQSDEKENGRSKVFVLERRDVATTERRENTSAGGSVKSSRKNRPRNQ